MKHAMLLIACLFALLGATVLQAQEVTAGLSSPSTTVGRPVEIVVTVRGVRAADVPERIQVPGLQIQLFGRSTRFEMHNLTMTSSLTYTYSVVAAKAGEYEIPPIEVRIGNRTLRSNPLRLDVSDVAAPPLPPPSISGRQAPGGGQARAGTGVPFFGDLVLSKKKAYVGEVVPTELRFYFKTNIGGEVGDRPNLAGEGFTVQKFANVPKREQIVNGETYIVFAFQTALSPVKSGKIEVPPASLEARLQVPGSAPQEFEDFFRNFGSMIPPGMFTNSQDVAVETQRVEMDVVSLPLQGRPDDFSGAIGKFEITASVSPAKVAPGEPATLRVVVSGQGNFDAMGAPVLTGDEGWRSYPPTGTFRGADAINFSGEKIYEFLLVARSDQTQTPGVKFNYFDPAAGNYVPLTQDPLEVDARAASSPVVSSDSSAATNVTAAPTPLVVVSKAAGGAAGWTPWIREPWFIAANAAFAAAWLVVLAAGLFRRVSLSPTGQRRRRKKTLEARFDGLREASDAEFVPRATEILHIALGTVDSPLQAVSRLETFDRQTAEALRDLLARQDEMKYASSSAKPLSTEGREHISKALRNVIV